MRFRQNGAGRGLSVEGPGSLTRPAHLDLASVRAAEIAASFGTFHGEHAVIAALDLAAAAQATSDLPDAKAAIEAAVLLLEDLKVEPSAPAG